MKDEQDFGIFFSCTSVPMVNRFFVSSTILPSIPLRDLFVLSTTLVSRPMSSWCMIFCGVSFIIYWTPSGLFLSVRSFFGSLLSFLDFQGRRLLKLQRVPLLIPSQVCQVHPVSHQDSFSGLLQISVLPSLTPPAYGFVKRGANNRTLNVYAQGHRYASFLRCLLYVLLPKRYSSLLQALVF